MTRTPAGGDATPTPPNSMAVELHHADAITIMRALPDHSVDLILTHLPGTQGPPPDWNGFWQQANRICKAGAVALMIGTGRDFIQMVHTNLTHYQYSLIWHQPPWPSDAPHHRPPSTHHEIAVFHHPSATPYAPHHKNHPILPGSVLSCPTTRNQVTSEPLVERLLLAYSHTGDQVLDVFLKDASVMRVAMRTGRRCLGITPDLKTHQHTHRQLRQVIGG